MNHKFNIREQILYTKVKALEAYTNRDWKEFRNNIRELQKLDHLLYDDENN